MWSKIWFFMYRCESWTIKKSEHQRIDDFELWWWRRLLRVPLDYKEIKPVNPKGWTEYSLEGLMLKLKLQYFAHLMWRTDFLEKILMLGKIEGRRRRGQQKRQWLDGIINSMEFEQAPSVGDGQGSLACCSPCGCRVGHNWVTELNWKHWIPLKSTSIPAINWIPNLYAALESPILLSSRKGQGSSQAFKSAL